MNPGFAGIENPLFYNPKTVMLFGDAKDSIDKLIEDVKALLSGSVLLGAATSRRPSRRSGRSTPCATPSSPMRAASGRCRRRCYVPAYPAGDFRAMPALGGGYAAAEVGDLVPGQPGARACRR